MIQVIYRYLEVLDTLYDEIIMDVNREDFNVGEKYKAKQEELGKELASFHLLSLLSRLLLLLTFVLLNQI